jgi:hypothetical protein
VDENEPVDEEFAITQLVQSRELLEQLKAKPSAPKSKLAIVLLEQARRRAWDALGRRGRGAVDPPFNAPDSHRAALCKELVMATASGKQVSEYQDLLGQLSASLELLERLRAEPEPPQLLIERLEAARLRMIDALASFESQGRSS